MMKIEGKTALAMVLFVVAVFLLASKFMLPSSVHVIVEGQSTYMKEIPNVYTVSDCVIIAIGAFLLGVCAFYLLLIGFKMPEKEQVKREVEPGEAGSESALQVQNAHVPNANVQAPEDGRAELLKILKGNEKKVIEVLIEYGEMNQADLSARTEIPKSTLSRILRDLEDRGLIFRYGYGMSKMVKFVDSSKKI